MIFLFNWIIFIGSMLILQGENYATWHKTFVPDSPLLQSASHVVLVDTLFLQIVLRGLKRVSAG